MGLKAVQSFVTKLHSDEEFKRRFAADPDKVLSQFKLSPAERASIKRASAARGSSVDAGALDWWFA